jgi:predicted TIM-barrel fold metal-dependent hydrolase
MIATPWGDIEVADAHVHFFSRGFYQLLAARKAGLTLEKIAETTGYEVPPEDPAALADRWAAELDRHGVGAAALIASLPGDEPSVAAAVERHRGRFRGFYMVNPAGDFAKLEKLAASGNLDAICLFPAMHCFSLHDDRVSRVVAIAARAGAIVFVHCGKLSIGIRQKLGLPSPFDLRYANPADLHALALEHPYVNFIIPHFGAGYLRESLMVCDLCPNVYLDTSSSNAWVRYEGLDLTEVFRRTLAVLSPERLLFGTDSSVFPRGWHRAIFDAQIAALHAAGADAAAARAILGGNFLRLTTRNR